MLASRPGGSRWDLKDSCPQSQTAYMHSKRTRSCLPWRAPWLGSPSQSLREGEALTAQRRKLRTRAGGNLAKITASPLL